MRTFNVNVNGVLYQVEVEDFSEIGGQTGLHAVGSAMNLIDVFSRRIH